MKSRLFQALVCITIIAFFVCGQMAFAEDVPHHWHLKALPRGAGQVGNEANPLTGGGPPAGLYGIGQAFVETPLGQPANTAGLELWPCFGGGGAAQPDCAYIGSTGTDDPPSLPGSVVLGTSAFVFYLAADSTDAPDQPFGCDASTSADATNYCGQTNTWYEDWSGDTADELTYILEATQNSSVVADSGVVDFGPNPYGTLSPVADVIIYGDQNFGTYGATGPNNGACTANLNYPIPGANFAPITSIAESGTTVTATLPTNDNTLAVGDLVYVTGTSNAGYNGSLVQLTTASNTTLKWTAASGIGTATGGQAINSTNYPIIVAAKKDCVDPVASSTISGAITAKEVKFAATTEIFSAAYTKSTSATTCAPAGGEPCYTVKYTEVGTDKASQSWYIWLR